MAGKRRNPTQRAIIYGGVLGGLSRDEVNKLLANADARDLPESSFRSIRDHYIPYFKDDFSRLGRAIQHPPTWSDLKSAGTALPSAAAPDGDPTEEDD
jgi:hypothetical protein